jgi:hypothetical protein
MSQLARRVTAAVLLAAILAMVEPAGAASPPSRPQTPRTSMVLGAGLLDQIFSWLGNLWFGDGSEAQRQGKAISQPAPSETDPTSAKPVELGRGSMIDPNG